MDVLHGWGEQMRMELRIHRAGPMPASTPQPHSRPHPDREEGIYPSDPSTLQVTSRKTYPTLSSSCLRSIASRPLTHIRHAYMKHASLSFNTMHLSIHGPLMQLAIRLRMTITLVAYRAWRRWRSSPQSPRLASLTTHTTRRGRAARGALLTRGPPTSSTPSTPSTSSTHTHAGWPMRGS